MTSMPYSPLDHGQPVREPAAGPRPARAKLPLVYIATWAILTTVSASYLALVALRSIDTAGPGSLASASMRAGENAESEAKAENEAKKLKQTLADFQLDIARLRTDLERRSADSDLVGSLAAIEERASIETGVPVSKPVVAATPPPQQQMDVASAAPLPQPTVVGPTIETGSIITTSRPGLTAASKPTAVPPAADAAPAPSAAGTEAPGAAVISFGPAIVKPAPKPFALRLASGTSLDEIRLSWSMLSEKNPDALRNLKPHFTATGTEAAGQVFDLVAGPIKSAVDARKICKVLASRGSDCQVGTFGGAAL